MNIKRADWVYVRNYPLGKMGIVKRIAADGSWADVNWGTHTKRMPTSVLAPEHTIPLGNGWQVTDVTRKRELEAEA